MDNYENLKPSISNELKKLGVILKNSNIRVFEYHPKEDKMILFNYYLSESKVIAGYVATLDDNSEIHPEDRWKVKEFFNGNLRSPLELRMIEDGKVFRKEILVSPLEGDKAWDDTLIGMIRDITGEKKQQEILEEMAKRDSLTKLYNQFTGKELINEYLDRKDPYASCGLMVIDIDYFKSVNDNYGHLFGDEVLIKLARLLTIETDPKDIVMRAGGDEFVILLKDIHHRALVKKSMQIVKAIRSQVFTDCDYAMTCSIGVCFLPENEAGYTYDQLFSNADWALYKAKENGRNRYEFCDNLQRFEMTTVQKDLHPDIDARYLHNDIVSTAFEIFEKSNSFGAAIRLLMEVVGIRFELDRITIIRTDTKEGTTGKQYQWVSENTPEVLESPGQFTKEDFLTLFQSYDEFGTTVLQYDNMGMYSEDAAKLLMQGGAKTTVYAAMYCDGKYTGAISYVVCKNKRYWTRLDRSQLGELTKIISVHLAKNLAMNMKHYGSQPSPEYDSLTGLVSFNRFREETEQVILGNDKRSYAMIYSDFENFKYFNQVYGYSTGDQLLKEFTNYVIGYIGNELEVFFTRVVADQFILFLPCENADQISHMIKEMNQGFIKQQASRFSEIRLGIRSGIYYINQETEGSSEAIDAANYARKQIRPNLDFGVRVFDQALREKRSLENEIINEIDSAMKQGQFMVYLQPRCSLKDFSIIGAEAMVRLKKKDGTILYPADFLPLYEQNGRIVDLDFYVFERVVAFLAKNNRLNRRQIPISVNASILHAQNDGTVKHYLDILEKYDVDPSLLEIELTETATISYYDNVKSLFARLQKVNMMTSLDDFGGGYSILNSVIDIPVNTVKIDRVFITNCEANEKGLYFLEQIVSMVKGLGYHVVCEGVESKEQAEILRNIGCEEAQGYWFSYPIPMDEFEKVMYEDR
ncbi:MAG: diguanylate cyclase [Lachnospiraceae bacterium]|nr:diguanylate cyclase [Lachnospiraceae bacterium]